MLTLIIGVSLTLIIGVSVSVFEFLLKFSLPGQESVSSPSKASHQLPTLTITPLLLLIVL